MKNWDTQRTRLFGIGLIVLGVVAIFGMWSLIPVFLLVSAGTYVYQRRRREDRIVEAVQSGLWLWGLALLFLLRFIFPGVLILAGASLLLRGREYTIDRKVEELCGRLGIRLPEGPPSASAPIATPEQTPTAETPAASTSDIPQAATGETTRL